MFLKISQYSQENTWVESIYKKLIKRDFAKKKLQHGSGGERGGEGGKGVGRGEGGGKGGEEGGRGGKGGRVY